MKLKEFLQQNPIIDKAALSRLMWPDNKSAPQKLNNKIKENTSGNGKQRMTEKDNERAKEVLFKLVEQIKQIE